MFFKKIFISVILSFLFYNFAISQEIIIVSKVNDEIITNIDIENEKKYLLLLNNKLEKLSEDEILNLAKNSLIREKVKKKEINYESLKEKIVLEALWNQVIFNNFNKRVRIDESLLKKKIIHYYNSKDKKYEYQLSEIVIGNEKDINLKKKEIYNYIKQFGFKIAANKYSSSDTSKYGGDIGWIKGTRLSDNIKNKISKIKVGDVSEPIQVSNGYLFLQVNNKKEIKEDFDLEKELKQQINFEKNRQLNQFSLNYYKKLKKNVIINENK